MKVYQSRHASRAWTLFYTFAGVAAFGLLSCAPAAARATVSHSAAIGHGTPQVSQRIVQGDDQGEDAGVPADQVRKYIAVYKAMQRNRSLTVEKAAARQGMTIEQFRGLENRVQRDGAAMQHVRDELQASAARAPASSATGH